MNQIDGSPAFVIKAMNAAWATALVRGGQLRLTNLDCYRRSENPGIADPNEGRGLYRVEGAFRLDDANAIFVWCASLPDTSKDVLFSLDVGYDTLIRVHDPGGFADLVSASAKAAGITLHSQIGPVDYKRGALASHEEVRRRVWGWNVFQKDACFSHQREFRFSFTYVSNVSGLDQVATEAKLVAELAIAHIDLTLMIPQGQVEIVPA